ncbi:uncharacterized protein MICPUCDRAFT_57898 [Micromonas pusilla CCMP1545]|uniref:Predicted protein n=1 Tax=Micromonas pusilla (strain CCMP1545) TaxID=564608 RepID=C1MT10_MICPC|nr:uncharacterized protein MICPUCDRAFT_57898 [Micromonas pusilla CCMP1545]EEH57231.1 predicted protein [Micromonas pusilla CCMP1545]|eukprot:XP_003058776.1 predicted protein [Micromonas pusilla CCMP1545]
MPSMHASASQQQLRGSGSARVGGSTSSSSSSSSSSVARVLGASPTWVLACVAAAVLFFIASATTIVGGVGGVVGVVGVGVGVRGGVASPPDVLCDGLPPYVVMVDAGSTGCRAHTFRVLPGDANAKPPRSFALRAVGEKVKSKDALASLSGKTDAEIADALLPMLTEAVEKVPARDRSRTPLYVWATAGLRVLSEVEQDELWASVDAIARAKTPFKIAEKGDGSEDDRIPSSSAHFKTIEGTDEGFYAWLAANYLAGVDLTRVGLGEPLPATIGALDVGGGSAQIVGFSGGGGAGASGAGANATAAAAAAAASPRSLAELKRGVYVKSYLGYGASQLEKKMWRELALEAKSGGANAADNPCGFRGRNETLGGRGFGDVDGFALRGTGDHAACLTATRAAISALQRAGRTEMRMPEELRGTKFYGMSLLYHVTHWLSIAFPGRLENFPTSPVSEFSSAAKDACAWEWDDVVARMDGKDENTAIDRLPGRCFDGVLAEALLTAADDDEGDGGGGGGGGGGKIAGGFGFDRYAKDVTFVENVNGGDVEWTMGAAISLLHPAAALGGGQEASRELDGRCARTAAAATGGGGGGAGGGGGGGGGGAASFFALVAVGGVVWYAATRGSGRGGTLSKSASGTLRGRP